MFDFQKKTVFFQDLLYTLDKASKDPKVIGLVVHIGNSIEQLNFYRIQELREAIIRFGNAKKKTVCYVEDIANPFIGYYLASAFGKIFVAPSGLIVTTGIHAVSMFLRNTFKKLEIEPQGIQKEEYKTALNTFTQEKYTDSHKEMMQKIIDDYLKMIVSDIAKSRGVEEQQVKKWFDTGITLGKEAVAQKMIDGLGFKDEVYDALAKECGLKKLDDANLLFWNFYLKKKGLPYQSGKHKVAVIYMRGPILVGEYPQGYIGSDTYARAIRSAIEDKSVKAIIIRIDSGGGSAVASDVINHEIIRAKQKNKPVYVFMESVAASGGYWVSMNATKIISGKATLTGSIGVVMLKLNMRNFFGNKLGITFDELATNKRSKILSNINSWTKDEEEATEKFIDEMYQMFMDKVHKGRNIPLETMRKIAKGRVYTGLEAKELGLVDELGDFNTVLDIVAKDLKIADKESICLVQFPKPPRLLDLLRPKTPKNSKEQDKLGHPSRQGYVSLGYFGYILKGLRTIGFLSGIIDRALAYCYSSGIRMDGRGNIATNPVTVMDPSIQV